MAKNRYNPTVQCDKCKRVMKLNSFYVHKNRVCKTATYTKVEEAKQEEKQEPEIIPVETPQEAPGHEVQVITKEDKPKTPKASQEAPREEIIRIIEGIPEKTPEKIQESRGLDSFLEKYGEQLIPIVGMALQVIVERLSGPKVPDIKQPEKDILGNLMEGF